MSVEDRGNYLGSYKSRTGFISIVDYYEGDEEHNVYCSHCWDYGFEVKLGPRILEKGEPVPPDHDQWLQCYECGTIYPIYEVKHESKIEDFVQPVDNPFDLANGPMFLSTSERRTKGSYQKRRNKRDRQKELDSITDPEIRREVQMGNIVDILYDTSR
jgi:hypothetical protein